MLTYRPIDLDLERDLDSVVELHLVGTFETDTLSVPMPFATYRMRWLKGAGKEAYLRDLAESLADPRTIAEIWEENGRPVGFLHVVFREIEAFGVTVAQIEDVEVALEHQRRGIGTVMLQHAEEEARARGARVVRAVTGVENSASQGLHAKRGFTIGRLLYEKRLDEPQRY